MRRMLCFCASLVLIFCGTSSVKAEIIKFYFDSSFVDTSREASNMLGALDGKGHTINTFSGTSVTAFANALSVADVLVIPELENGDLFGSLSIDAKNTITNFVNSGGRLIIAGDEAGNSRTLLNGLFGFSLTEDGTQKVGGSTKLDSIAAAGTLFASGPPVLPNANGTTMVHSDSLPTGALNLYHDDGQTSVFQKSLGSGSITYLGFDWWQNSNIEPWNKVLHSSINDPLHMPEPASLTLFGLGSAGLIALGWRRRNRKQI